MTGRYDGDVLATGWRRPSAVPEIAAEPDLVVEDPDSGFCGAVVGFDRDAVILEDRHGRRRSFPLALAAFLLDGEPVTLVRPRRTPAATAPKRTASGSVAVADQPARVALQSRIYVEGVQDAELVERVWGADLRVEGVVVEPLGGIDDLVEIVRGFRPSPGRRLGVLVDHLVAGTKESRIAAQVSSPYVIVRGHPYVDVWQAVKPSAVGIPVWPYVPRGHPWKEGVCAALGWPADTSTAWKRILGSVRTYADLEPSLIGRVEELIDFIAAGTTSSDSTRG